VRGEPVAIIGALLVELEIADGITLKDKRQVIRSLLDRIRGRFNVGAAEVGHLDSVRFASIAVVGVANERPFLNEMMSKVVNLIDGEPRVVLLDQELEFI
jgi:uncharacterized protein YlxP (DUF503 family)